jgi:hypothetical protein
MRSTLDILVAVNENQPVEKEELRLAIVALSSIHHFVTDSLKNLLVAAEADPNTSGRVKLRVAAAKDTLKQMHQAKKTDPEKWLGPQNIPGTPEHDARLKAAKNLFEKATGEKL